MARADQLQRGRTVLAPLSPVCSFVRRALFLPLIYLGLVAGNCAASDIFITISGIPGGSTAAGHSGAMDVLAMSHEISRSVVHTKGGGVSIGALGFGDLAFTKPVDKSTPLLYEALAQGGGIPSAEIDFVQTSSNATLFYKVTLGNAYITSLSTGASGGETTPTENVSLFYSQITWSYIQVEGEYRSTWDRISNTGTNQFLFTDTDADGLPDAWEMQYFGTLAYGANDDPDHDGLSNYQEYIAGTNPNDPNSILRVTKINLANGQTGLTWSSVAGKTYTIFSANQVDGPYTPILTMPSAGNGETSTNLASSLINQLYRVGVK
jgi:type VI secretion system secreted protein Hcp